MRRERDHGYALVAAVTAVAAFAYLAFQVLAAGQGSVAQVAARADHARLIAAADAGVMIAIHGLAQEDPSVRWSIDGSARNLDFDGVNLIVAVNDERSKAPLAGLNDSQARVLFQGVGASGPRLDALVGEFRDWRDQGLANASSGSGQSRFRSVGELMALSDMDAELYGRIVPSVTVFLEPGDHFDSRYATPLAIAVMRALADPDAATPTIALEQPDLQNAPDSHLQGRTLSVHVVARDDRGGEARRTAIVELTGARDQPYWIRYAE